MRWALSFEKCNRRLWMHIEKLSIFFKTEKTIVTKSRVQQPCLCGCLTTCATPCLCSDGATNEAAKATAHVVANMRFHRRSHARTTGHFMAGGTSCALANATCLNTSTVSSLHRPPVSRPTPPPICTGSTQPVLDEWLPCLCGSRRQCLLHQVEVHRNALRSVTSTASWDPPKHGRSWDNMRRSSVADTPTLISFKNALNRTDSRKNPRQHGFHKGCFQT